MKNPATRRKNKRIRHKARLGMAEIEEAFKHIKTDALHGLVGWLFAVARGDDFTEGSRELREELSRYLETQAAYERKYRTEGRQRLGSFKPETADDYIEAMAGDYRPNV